MAIAAARRRPQRTTQRGSINTRQTGKIASGAGRKTTRKVAASPLRINTSCKAFLIILYPGKEFPMKTTARVCAMMLFSALLFASPCLAASQYYVYCVKGKGPVVETRSINQYSMATGTKTSDIRIMSQFPSQKDAVAFAKNTSQCK